ncbi:aminotransferase class IV [Spirochaeta lutea]|uniref:Branched-chain-amino-acid aminotransferase n=1 Tax=Spirochaeta lutea TaxID=1480694 RepID=A0A098QYR3_9SPIO|nr:aminotransferase class IV [Spirochaeta lutea]KGE71632.1 branched-chain amino acid aminotransferase [Spirochaeta lutea]
MAAGFTLSVYPWVYKAKYDGQGWVEEFQEKPHRTPEEEARMGDSDRASLLSLRNSFPDLPLINYTSQYGMGCFEGLKAYPQPGGGLKVFRPDMNASRFEASMKGLKMPGYPGDLFEKAVIQIVARNAALGFRPEYWKEWEANHFVTADSVYLRPFSLSEGGIGLNLSSFPWVVIAATPVGSYFDPDANSKAITTDMVRATPNGTGWIKCNANYVIPTLAKKQAIAQGYMEAVFLDSREGRFIEEGSSCNIFFRLKDGTLVTPAVEDRILNGINRRSVIQLALDKGVAVEERPISIDEAMEDGQECFVTGTAAGVSYIESLTHQGRTSVFNQGKMGDLTLDLLKTLKGIQYGAVEDVHSWMVDVPLERE